MNITYICNSTVPSRAANSIHVMRMCQAFVVQGHRVALLAPDRGGEAGVDDPFAFYGISQRFELIKLPWMRWRGRGYLYGWLAAQQAKRLAPDLVYGRYLPACYFASELGLDTVLESHAPVEADGALCRWMWRRLRKSPKLVRLVVISHALAQHYAQGTLARADILVAADAADPPTPSMQPLTLPGNGTLKVGYVGHLYPGRGIEMILALATECSWADFHIVGGTDADIAHWRGQGRRLSNVYFHGFITPADTERYRDAVDVVLAPYQPQVSVAGTNARVDTARWMSPLKLFEYMAAGKAILCSDLPVLREVLTHGVNALLCAPNDTAQWAQQLACLKDNVSLRDKLGVCARQTFAHAHTWASRARHVLDGLQRPAPHEG